jgi:hypothetical protein
VRSDWARPGAREAAGSVGLRAGRGDGPDGGDGWPTETAATYTDRYRNLPFQESCATTGILERRLLDAVASAG